MNRKEYDKKRYQERRQAQILQGVTKFQQVEYRRALVSELYRQGLKTRYIAERVGASLRVVQGDITYLKKEGEL